MKKILALFSILFSFLSATAQTWTLQASGSNSTMNDVQFVSATRGWAAAENGTVLFTNNAGLTWTPQNTQTSSVLQGLSFVSANKGWVCGYGGKIAVTTNGGTTWTPQTSGTTNKLYDIHFFNTDTGWAVGELGTIIYTTNGGTTWTPQTTGVNGYFFAVFAVSGKEAWIAGLGGLSFYTTDGGTTWNNAVNIIGLATDINGMFFLNKNMGWVVGMYGEVKRTVDRGTTWTDGYILGNDELFDVHFVSPSHGLASADNNKMYESTDSGKTWVGTNLYPVSGPWDMRSVYFVNNNLAWAVGENGKIIVYGMPSGIGDVAPIECLVYPNPSADKVKFVTGNDDVVSITVFDLQGNELLKNTAGNEMDISALAAGVYLAEIKTRQGTALNKLLKK